MALDGAVYASPLVIGGTTIVATENNSVYAIDASRHVLWRHRLGAPSPAGERPCGDIDPLGITGTPIYNAANNTLYVAAELGGPPRHRLYALNFATGATVWSRTPRPAGRPDRRDAGTRRAQHHRRSRVGAVRRPGR